MGNQQIGAIKVWPVGHVGADSPEGAPVPRKHILQITRYSPQRVGRFHLSVHYVSSSKATYSAGVRTMTPPLDRAG